MTGGLIIAAPASGCGKTVVTLGLLRHLARSGVVTASAKMGPDYIDAAFHAAATGRACINLDVWAMREVTLSAAMTALAIGAELVVCEGVMGLFDGADARTGSTADLAAMSGWPVVLVVDVGAQAASAAAVVRGFATHRRDVEVAGVLFNRVGGAGHAAVLRDAMADHLPDVAVLGCLPYAETLRLPERHLGLVQALEHADLARFLDRAADLVAAHVDMARLSALARPLSGPDAIPTTSPPLPPLPPLGQRIAVADDVAFAFRYPLATEGWRGAGCELVPFSPLADEPPAEDCDAVYLPGGYPELHAGRLAGNRRFLSGVRETAARGAVVFGECGGYMVLGERLIDADGDPHMMAGLLPVETSFADRGLHLGYRRVSLASSGPLGRSGAVFRGHEFHFAKVLREGPGQPLFDCADAVGRPLGATGFVAGSVMGSFVHLIDREDGADG